MGESRHNIKNFTTKSVRKFAWGTPRNSRMKSFMRLYFWWVKVNEDNEKRVKWSESCQKHQSKPASALVHPWEHTNKPWVRLHVNYLGPFLGKIFLVIVDSYLKCAEIFPVSYSTSQTTISCLSTCFATNGQPQICVSDNRSCFTNKEIGHFMKKNSILQIKSTPYHPATSGCAELLKALLEKWKGQVV